MRDRTRFSARQIAFAGVLGAVTVVLGTTSMGFIQIPPISITIMHIPTIIAGVLQGPVIGGIVGAMFGGFSMYQAQTSVNPLDKVIFSNPLIAVVPRILIGVVAHYVFRLVRGKTGRNLLVTLSSILVGYTGYTMVPALSTYLVSLSSVQQNEGLTGTITAFGNGPVRMVIAFLVAVISALLVHWVQKRFGHGPALAAAAGSLTNTVLVLGLIVAFGFLPGEGALSIGVVNGVPEAVVAMILTGSVYRAVGRFVEG